MPNCITKVARKSSKLPRDIAVIRASLTRNTSECQACFIRLSPFALGQIDCTAGPYLPKVLSQAVVHDALVSSQASVVQEGEARRLYQRHGSKEQQPLIPQHHTQAPEPELLPQDLADSDSLFTPVKGVRVHYKIAHPEVGTHPIMQSTCACFAFGRVLFKLTASAYFYGLRDTSL